MPLYLVLTAPGLKNWLLTCCGSGPELEKLENGGAAQGLELTEARWQHLDTTQANGHGEVRPASPVRSPAPVADDEEIALMEDRALSSSDRQKDAAPSIPPLREQLTPRALLAGMLVVFLLCIMTHRSNMSTGG